MKIAVVGAGAVGSVIGGLLSRAGEDITLIGRKPHVDAINRSGLILEGESGEIVIKVKAAENLDFKPDLALLTVKAQDVESSIRTMQPYLSGTQVVTMQNGVRSDDQVAELLGKDNIISSVVIFNGQFLEPGKALYSVPFSNTAILIGEPFGNKRDRLQTLSTLLDKAIGTDISEDIHASHWTKLLWNLQTAVPAVTGMSYQDGYQYPEVRELTVNLLKEGLKIVKAAGIKTADIPGLPMEPIETIAGESMATASTMIKKIAESMGKVPMLGSTLQSIKRGTSTEVDYLNGEIVKLGEKNGILTPVNSLIVGLVHQVETTGKFLTVDEISQRFG